MQIVAWCPEKFKFCFFFFNFLDIEKNTFDMQLVESMDVEFMDKEGQGGPTI